MPVAMIPAEPLGLNGDESIETLENDQRLKELAEAEHVVLDTTRPMEASIASLRERLPLWPEGLTG